MTAYELVIIVALELVAYGVLLVVWDIPAADDNAADPPHSVYYGGRWYDGEDADR